VKSAAADVLVGLITADERADCSHVNTTAPRLRKVPRGFHGTWGINAFNTRGGTISFRMPAHANPAEQDPMSILGNLTLAHRRRHIQRASITAAYSR